MSGLLVFSCKLCLCSFEKVKFVTRWFGCVPQASSSSESVEGPCVDCAAKSYDAVVFDVLKVTPEEFAVSDTKFYLFFFGIILKCLSPFGIVLVCLKSIYRCFFRAKSHWWMRRCLKRSSRRWGNNFFKRVSWNLSFKAKMYYKFI